MKRAYGGIWWGESIATLPINVKVRTESKQRENRYFPQQTSAKQLEITATTTSGKLLIEISVLWFALFVKGQCVNNAQQMLSPALST